MRNSILLFGLWLGFFQILCAQQMETFNRINDDGYNYWFYSPDSVVSDSVRKPLIVFLHGQSLSGRNINNVLRYGTLDALRRGRDIDAFVLAPQNQGGRWVPSKVIDLVDWAIENYAVDSCRVYVLGMSLGGFGTINVAAAYPDRFAAAMALCGGGNNPDYKALCQIPLWILHGTADRAVKIRDSDEVVKGMRSVCKPERMKYNRLKGLNHSILARIFYMPQTYQWLFAHSLNDSIRRLCVDYEITKTDFSSAYNDLESPTWNHIKRIDHLKLASSKAYNDVAESAYYKVKSGDTLTGIARRYHITVKKLCQLNGIKETTILQVGRKLKIR